MPSNLSGRLICGYFGLFPNVFDAWFPCKCVMDSQNDSFSCCICLNATTTSSIDKTISSLKMDMAKEICNQKLRQEVGGPRCQQHV